MTMTGAQDAVRGLETSRRAGWAKFYSARREADQLRDVVATLLADGDICITKLLDFPDAHSFAAGYEEELRQIRAWAQEIPRTTL